MSDIANITDQATATALSSDTSSIDLLNLVEKAVADKTLDLFHDQYGDPMAVLLTKERRLTVSLHSRPFRHFLQGLFYRHSGKPVKNSKLDEYIESLSAFAMFDCSEHHLEPRVARLGTSIYYDLGKEAVRINKNGWFLDENPPNLFRSYSVMKSQSRPAFPGDLDWLLDYFNIQQFSDRLLMKVYIVCSFIPNIPHPIYLIHGPQGSGKSLLVSLLMDLIDPSHVTDLPLGDPSQLLQSAAHRWVVPLDNLSRISHDHSDLLCKLVTGVGISKRALYTNDDDFFRSLRRVLLINGLTPSAEKSDLLDRCLLLPLERISDSSRKPEAEVRIQFEQQKPALLGACFEALSKAMKIQETLKYDRLPRMADFAVWGAAIAIALGETEEAFFAAYESNISRQNEEAIESSPVATVIAHYLRQNPRLSGTVTDVHKAILVHAGASGVDQRVLPKTPKSFGRVLVEITPSLESLGYCITKTRGHSRMVEILPPKGTVAQEDIRKRIDQIRNNALTSLPSLNRGSLSESENSEGDLQ